MFKRFGWLAVSALCAASVMTACDEDSEEITIVADTIDCNTDGTSLGVIKNDLFSAVADVNDAAHSKGSCKKDEFCVTLLDSDQKACSAYDQNFLMCSGKKVDASQDSKHCGKCQNACGDGVDCVNGKCQTPKCASSGSFIASDDESPCCDKAASRYVYWLGKSDCQSENFKAQKAGENPYTNALCLTDEMLSSLYSAEIGCFVKYDAISHMSDSESCGLNENFKKCELIRKQTSPEAKEENLAVCDTGRCCISNDIVVSENSPKAMCSVEGYDDKETFDANICCSGIAKYESHNGGGHNITCVSDREYCKTMCGSDDCEQKASVGTTGTCKMYLADQTK